MRGAFVILSLAGYTEPDFTQLSQQQVGVALLRNLNAGAAVDIADFDALMYHRSASRSEIDFVGRGLRQVAIESKYTDDAFGRAAQTIQASQWQGIIASRSAVVWGETADVLPAPFVALLLGA